jgi:hypothetical protein
VRVPVTTLAARTQPAANAGRHGRTDVLDVQQVNARHLNAGFVGVSAEGLQFDFVHIVLVFHFVSSGPGGSHHPDRK